MSLEMQMLLWGLAGILGGSVMLLILGALYIHLMAWLEVRRFRKAPDKDAFRESVGSVIGWRRG